MSTRQLLLTHIQLRCEQPSQVIDDGTHARANPSVPHGQKQGSGVVYLIYIATYPD